MFDKICMLFILIVVCIFIFKKLSLVFKVLKGFKKTKKDNNELLSEVNVIRQKVECGDREGAVNDIMKGTTSLIILILLLGIIVSCIFVVLIIILVTLLGLLV